MLSNTIKTLRKHNYLNQTEFAKKLGVAQATVSQWENDLTRPNAEQLKTISTTFNVSIDDLLSGEPEKDKVQEKAPRTPEARAVSFGMDTLPKEHRELILNMVTAMYPNTFKKGDDDDPRL